MKKPYLDLPTLLDRELFFGDPEISCAQLSPDGDSIAFLRPWNGVLNVFVKSANESMDQARRLTAETQRPLAECFWSWDSHFILFTKDHDGDENYNIYSVEASGKVAADGSPPLSRNLTGLNGVYTTIYALPKVDPDTIFLGLNDRDRAWHDLYELKISTGKLTLLRRNTERITSWVFDLRGRLRLAMRSTENGDTELLRVEGDNLRIAYSCTVKEYLWPLQYHLDGERVYLATNKRGDLVSLVLLDPVTGAEELVDSDPMCAVDLGSAMFSKTDGRLVETRYFYDREAMNYFWDQGFKADYGWLKEQFPGKDIDLESRTQDERFWLLKVNSDTEPGQTHLYDRLTRSLKLQFLERPELPRQVLVELNPVTYDSSDGLKIPGYLALPKGVPAQDLPLLVIPHGGPWWRETWGYNPTAQFFANRGYAVLLPNFRGSTGYGKKFMDAGDLEWGGKIQDDVTFGVRHLVLQGIADPKRVGILGRSYGGYAALAGVAFTPDLYAAAVSIVGPSNLVTLLRTIPPYWESGRKMEAVRIGDLETAEGRALLEERSPLKFSHKIKTPLLIAQGANDPRVNRAEAEQIVIALRDRGFSVEYILAPDEGHWFIRPDNNLALYMAAEHFLAEHLEGRFQAGGSLQSLACLDRIKVDLKTVTLRDS